MMAWVMALVQCGTLVMQILILFVVGWSCLWALRTKKATAATLQAIYEYRREISWLTARLEALEQKAKGQGNVRVENGRGK
jgi:hypothetical protein